MSAAFVVLVGDGRSFVAFLQDINNTAVPLSLKHATADAYLPPLKQFVAKLYSCAREWDGQSMLARTCWC